MDVGVVLVEITLSQSVAKAVLLCIGFLCASFYPTLKVN